ncbi:aprataxin and PNK-like factor isoform X2 [Armigeres subalbatus]|uniref:aprataxin and PNK-like factor isoform X2 n=1 Tax=Armigeres subalbatus TaxID=124917 RepID=UPI002ED4BA58
MSVQLYLFDCEKEVNIPVASSEIVIGRDSILQCDDKRISRQHGIIKYDGNMTERIIHITSTHANPIFLRTADQVLNILTKDLTATLRHGEKFALLPDQYWFEVRFKVAEAGEEPVSSSSAENPEEVVTSAEEGITGGATIRVRTMEEVNSEVASTEARVLPDWMATGSGGEKRKNLHDSEEADSSKKVRSEEKPTIKDDPDTEEASTSQTKPIPDGTVTATTDAVKTEIKKETPDSTSSPPLRPSCEFGIRCYRHTADHRAQFAHPNDSDYRRPTHPPAPQDAPHCPYGASCYRRNPMHFRDFQHPDSSTVTPAATNAHIPAGGGVQTYRINGRRGRRRLARNIIIAAIANPNLFDGSEDEDDEDDLFDYEDDSDEYRPGGDVDDVDDDDEDEDDDDGLEVLDDDNEE